MRGSNEASAPDAEPPSQKKKGKVLGKKAALLDNSPIIPTPPAESDSSPLPPESASTPPPLKSASGVKRAHDDVSDQDLDDAVGEINQMRPPDDPPNGGKRQKTPDNSHMTDIGSVRLIDHSENQGLNFDGAPIKSAWPDILYRTQVEDEKSGTYNHYYRDRKYEEWSDPLKDEDRRSESLFQIFRDVVGNWQDDVKSKPESMDKDQWRDENRHIKFGKDFTIKVQRRPAMRINDPVCRSVMKFLIKYDPGQILTGDSFTIHWPWHILMQYHEQIGSLRELIKNGEATHFRVSEANGDIEVGEILRRIDLLFEMINDVYTAAVKPELQNHKSRLADFKHLWLLFKPGEEVFARVNGELAAFIVLANRNHHKPGDSKTTKVPTRQLIVQVWNLRVVAGRLERHMSQIAIDEYEESRLIDTLPVFPCKYVGTEHEAQAQREKLIERGKKYFNIIKQPYAHMDHEGLTRDSKPRKYNGRVIIDPMSYVNYGAAMMKSLYANMDWKWRPRGEENSVHFEPLKPSEVIRPEDDGGGQLWEKYNGLDPTDSTTQEPGFLEDRHFLLLPRNIRGYSLRDKQWETYDVESLSKIKWGIQDTKHPFPGLILDEEKQKMLQANCRTAESRRQSPDLPADLIGGKGEGTVFLLHGPPGVGKTYTVECIANYTEQPLLSLSGCDIGSTENSETTVQHWFDLAQAWDALILIDEADIFLTWRQPDNLGRNLLVTTFLRTLESFPGTLFLTTNRIGQLDLAVNSRVDIAIHFDVFDFENQKRLWLQYFDKINASGRAGKSVFIKDTVIDTFFKDDFVKVNSLSGREIRNAFKQSVKIARHDSKIQDRPQPNSFKLKLKHLQQAIRNCKEKTQHIVEANRVRDEAELAERRSERQQGLIIRNQPEADNRQVEP